MTLTANLEGQITGHFTIPANIKAGSKRVRFFGEGGSYGEATFIGQGQLTKTQLQQVTTQVVCYWYDPLAQTFMVDKASNLSGIDLWFTAKGASDVHIQIRETENGFPNMTVIGECRMTASQISLTGATRFIWKPIQLEAMKEYAVVIACDDADTAVAIAELGKFDSISQKWITSQPYQVGVLLSSSNGRTWTAHQDRDLKFDLLTSIFSTTTMTIDLGTVAVTDAAEVIVMASVERPSTNTDVRFQLTLPDVGNTILTFLENQVILLPEIITGNITWRAILSGTTEETPRLHPDVQLAYGSRSAESTYISREITLQNAGNSKVNVYFEALTPGTSTVAVKAQNDTAWLDVPSEGTVPVGDGWEERKHVLNGFIGDATRIKLMLSGSSRYCPRVRKLRVIVT